MKLLRSLLLFAIVLWSPFLVRADSGGVIVDNHDGTFTSNIGKTNLSLVNSTLFGVSGLGMGYDCAGLSGSGACYGTVTLTTGNIIPGGNSMSLTPSTGHSTWLGGGAGTSFDVTENAGHGLNGFTFMGMFDTTPGANTWSCVGVCSATKGTWQLGASIIDAVLTIGGKQYDLSGAVSTQITTMSTTVVKNHNGSISFTDKSGTSNFPSPVPEPGTLSLFGGGLIAIGLLSKRLASRGQQSSLG